MAAQGSTHRGTNRSPATSGAAGRAAARRRQEARTHRQARPPGHGRPLQTPRGAAGWHYTFRRHRRHHPTRPRRVYPDETAASAIAFLPSCQRFYAQHGITIERVLSDNGTCFKRRWADACADRSIQVRKTRPYRPQTNGNVERFIRTLLELWAYAYPYQHERERAAALPPALDSYNRYRRHHALGGLTPLQRVNNLSGTNN